MKQIHKNVNHRNCITKSCRGTDLLKRRAELLTGEDRALMTMYLKNGSTFYQMAKLAGVDQTTIARRIRRLINRLVDGVYIYCLRKREKFTEQELDIARDYFLEGISFKKIAIRRQLSFYRVRQTIKRVQRLVELNENRNKEQTKESA